MTDRGRILVVQPDGPFAALLVRGLREQGFDVRVVSTLASALVAEPCELCICALELPDGGALALMAALESRGAGCPTLLTADHATVEDCRRAMRAGARELFLHPFPLRELLDAAALLAPRAALPSPQGARLTITARASLENQARAVRELLAFLVERGFAGATRARAAGAAAEAVENVLRHAYPDGEGPFHLDASSTGGRLRVEVCDEGVGFQPLRMAAAHAEAAGGKGGLARARALAESLHLENREGGGARVVLELTATSCTFGEERGVDLSDHDYLDPATARRVLASLADGTSESAYHLSPALAVCVGRLLSAARPDQEVRS